MTLDQYFQLTGYLLYPGQSEVYRGQCVQSVMIKIKNVDGIEPPVYPNAKDYWFNGIPGYSVVTDDLQPGDIAVYNGHGGFPEGHIAVVSPRPPEVFEQNADPDGSPMHFFTRANTYLLGHLRLKGADMPSSQDIADGLTIQLAYNLGLGRQPTTEEIQGWENQKVTVEQILRSVWTAPEHVAYVNGDAIPLKPGKYIVG